MESRSNFLLGLFIGVGTALAGYFVSQTLYNAKVALNTAEVKGLAEKRVKADIANWDITLTFTGLKKSDIPNLYKKAQADQKVVIDLLKENGLQDSELNVGVLNYRQAEYRDKNQNLVDQKHVLLGMISVETTQVDKIRKVRSKLNALIAKGIDIQNNAPRYFFSKLNEIKPLMLKEATKNARVAAKEFAANAGVKVGGIRSARQGNFFVRDIGSDYSDSNKIEKNVRVVTTITFYLN